MKEIFIIAEIGINHCGDLDVAKQLVLAAKDIGADAVKFQKRDIDQVYSREFLASPRESQWGSTQRDQKERLEFGKEEYQEIAHFCKCAGIEWFASAWDKNSQKFLRQFDLKFNKIASPMLSHHPLLELAAEEKRHTFISTGMHSIDEIAAAVQIFESYDCPYELMHCCSVYPMSVDKANLRAITTLQGKFMCDVGYSGHETGLAISVAAAALGITSLERHITLDRAMPGSDQAASVEPGGFKRLVTMVRAVQGAMGDGVKTVLDEEKPIRRKLAPLEFPYVE
mgnify:CR=1 FL=1